MPTGKVKMFNEERGFGFIKPDDGSADILFHVSDLRECDEILKDAIVTFEIGVDPKSGKTKAVSVDLAYRLGQARGCVRRRRVLWQPQRERTHRRRYGAALSGGIAGTYRL